MEISLYYGDVWRRHVCAALSAFSGGHGHPCNDDGICGGQGQQKECGKELYGTGKAGTEMALKRLSRYAGELCTDDVLHYCGGLDALLFLPDAFRPFYRKEYGGGGRGIRKYAGGSACSDGLYGDHRGGRHPDLLHGVTEGC